MSDAKPQRLTAEMLADATHLVTMGCGEARPVAPPRVRRLDWPREDPKGKDITRVREIRDEIRRRVETILATPE